MQTLRRGHDQLQLTTYRFADDGAIPNHPTWPMLVYKQILLLAATDPAAAAEQLFQANGWGDIWRNGIYNFHHYHSNAHEVLAICRGHAAVQFGGEPGVILTVQAGDIVLLPAGTGHKRLSSSNDLLVVGAYPPGQQPDLGRGESGERPQVLENIERVPRPGTDPVYGAAGPMLDVWH